jgi:hypothetical protein
MAAPVSTEFSAKRISIGDRLWHGWSILTAKLHVLSGRAHAGEISGTSLQGAQQGTASDPRGVKRKRPFVVSEALRDASCWVLQAASFGSTSKSFLELAMGIARAFIASGSSRTRLTCSRPFSRLASLTSTYSASWKVRSKLRAAIPW